ncbi:threonylcarbamoyl-AMP synthase [bacterium SCSIO 12741]|nr:threonylcarbamoyl-AMP synthase [bacterium SCSIO 12741]
MTEKEIIYEAVQVLQDGGLIIYPTDTIWGLGCDATNSEAVKKVFELKQRADSKSLISLVSSDALLNRCVTEVPSIAWDLLDESVDPMTVVYPQARWIASEAIAEDGSAGIRLVKEGFAHKLVHRLNRPLISTSANISGEPSPRLKEEISSSLLTGVDYVVNLPGLGGGTGKASSVIKLELNGEIKILRK